MEFMLKDRDHFQNYVAEDFTRYIQRKRQDGCYANNPEIQASSELFNRPIEVYIFVGAGQSSLIIYFVLILKSLPFHRYIYPRRVFSMVLLTFSMDHMILLEGKQHHRCTFLSFEIRLV